MDIKVVLLLENNILEVCLLFRVDFEKKLCFKF